MLSSPCPTYQSTTNKNKSKRSVQRENRNKKICRQVPALPTKNKLLSDTSNLLQVSVPQEKIARVKSKMNRVLCLGLVGLLAVLAGSGVRAEEDMGTVIGIDLGTTYSW